VEYRDLTVGLLGYIGEARAQRAAGRLDAAAAALTPVLSAPADSKEPALMEVRRAAFLELLEISLASDPGKALAEAVLAVCDSLARQIAADAEGGTKVIEIRVTGAKSDDEARRAAAAIANSPLVKTAFFGEDPNWGRIVSAAGYAGISSGPETMRLTLGDLVIFSKGRPAAADEKRLARVMKAHDIAVHLDMGAGRGAARYLTCDFSYDYVKINAEYTT
jgi:glutamate N-acetyltransferase/amino-acid N-acetyltransferase